VKDLASGEVVAWKLAMHMEMSLVLDTVEAMKNNPDIATASLKDAMIHSDQGVHYTNPQYIER